MGMASEFLFIRIFYHQNIFSRRTKAKPVVNPITYDPYNMAVHH